MPGFYVLPAILPVDVTFVPDAADEQDAVKQACRQTGVVGGTLAVVPASALVFRKVEAGTLPLTVTESSEPQTT